MLRDEEANGGRQLSQPCWLRFTSGVLWVYHGKSKPNEPPSRRDIFQSEARRAKLKVT